jgi:hypothetical protein
LGQPGRNAAKERRDELRKLAITRIDAMEKAAIVRIELESLNGQTEIATHGITSDAGTEHRVADAVPVL